MTTTVPLGKVEPPTCARLEVQFATGNVLVRGHTVKLSSTEHALLFSIARHRYPSTRDQLIDLVWGDSLGEKSQNAFNIALHRLRRRLGGNDSILHGSNGYSLCEGAVVDLAHLETLARSVKRASSISDQDLNSIGRIYEGWRRSAALISDRYEWLETTSHRARTLTAELGVAFGRGVLQRGNGATALEIARDLLAADGCDESAAELAICALLQRRDRSEALRVFRTYSESLQRELGLRPSHSVQALFDQTLTAAT
jgi:DNA-binding SARP family transcriptional activator